LWKKGSDSDSEMDKFFKRRVTSVFRWTMLWSVVLMSHTWTSSDVEFLTLLVLQGAICKKFQR
jgi:hypothetical protein